MGRVAVDQELDRLGQTQGNSMDEGVVSRKGPPPK